MNYKIRTIQKLIENALSDDDLQNLCQAEFNIVYKKFTSGQNRHDRIRALIDHVSLHREIPKLLKVVEEINSTVFGEFESHLISDDFATIPFVIAAMTRSEAEDLLNGSILDVADNVTSSEKKLFERFKSTVIELTGNSTEEQLDQLLSSYQEKREDWVPLGHDIPVQQMVEKTFDDFYQYFGKPSGLYFRANFKRTASYFYDESNNKLVLAELRQGGGIIVVDPISMFHPKLKEYLLEGCGIERIGVIVITPTNTKMTEVKELLQQTAEKQLRLAWSRFSRFEPLCEIVGINHPEVFSRRLYHILSKLVETDHPQKDIIEDTLESLGAPKYAVGYDQVIPGVRS